MILRALLSVTLLPLAALAQVQVFVLNGTTQTAVGSSLPVGTAALGDTIQTQFRVHNTGSQSVPLTVSLSGEGFSIQCIPAPYVPPDEESAFCVNFTPAILGSFSAILDVNSLSITLTGSAVTGATVTVSGSTTPLTAGAVVNFKPEVINQTETQTFTLSNSSSSTLTVNSVTVSGTAFSGPTGASFPLQIGPGQAPTFQVTFSPQSGTPYQGTLLVDGRSFTLDGQGLDPPLPSASIVFASTVGASAQQDSVTIPLASAAQIAGTGTLTMTFQPSVAGVTDDPAIQFLSGPFRQATVTIAVGATSATIGGRSSMPFQTGTTAGTITFSLTLETNAPQQSTLTIPGATIVLDSATAVRELGSLEVAFTGFDNTYSASQLAFTFYDLNSNPIPQGVINVDATAGFQQYFSGTQAGGSFALLATFPVSGNTAALGFVTAAVTNSLGTTTAQLITIGN